jgi:hypothetical protein
MQRLFAGIFCICFGLILIVFRHPLVILKQNLKSFLGIKFPDNEQEMALTIFGGVFLILGGVVFIILYFQ